MLEKLTVSGIMAIWKPLFGDNRFAGLASPLPICNVRIDETKCLHGERFSGYDWCQNEGLSRQVEQATSNPSSYFFRLEACTPAQRKLACSLCENRNNKDACMRILLYAFARHTIDLNIVGEDIAAALQPEINQLGIAWHPNCRNFLTEPVARYRPQISVLAFCTWAAESLSAQLERNTMLVYETKTKD